MAWTVGLVFFVAFVTQLVASGPLDLWNTDAATWQQAVNSGVMALIALAINAAAPWVDRYGVGS
jgi:hypothetical protein